MTDALSSSPDADLRAGEQQKEAASCRAPGEPHEFIWCPTNHIVGDGRWRCFRCGFVGPVIEDR